MQFQPNPDMEKELRELPQFRIAMRDVAVEAQHKAVSFADAIARGPWMPRPRGKRWSSAIEVVQQDDGKEVLLANTDYAGHLVEWGSKNNPPHAILRRAVRAVGLRLSETEHG